MPRRLPGTKGYMLLRWMVICIVLERSRLEAVGIRKLENLEIK